ncbi:C3 and PZP-like alpha-2-macroglobulin domain-containing protein 8 [Branchiostoma belcheri]|nr:C3 and PZP-like alpha-2-macroglobulin domain-containing protein 8 [Branchiostoma belcheri]
MDQSIRFLKGFSWRFEKSRDFWREKQACRLATGMSPRYEPTLSPALPWLLFAALLGPAAASSPGAGYMAVAPLVFRPGVEEVISITMFNVTSPVHVEATVHINRASVASAAETITGKGSLRLKVPHDAKGKATLKVCGNCAQAARVGEKEVFFFHNSTSVVIEERGSAVFIQTDKPVYKPGQTGQQLPVDILLNIPIQLTALSPRSLRPKIGQSAERAP